MHGLSYTEVGATAGDLPDGYHHLRWVEPVGTGEAAFRRAAEAVMTWGMHRAVVRVVSAPPRAVVGETVRMRYLGQSFACVVVEVEDTAHRVGFAYGTLPGHPERGEERFVVTHDAVTDAVRIEVTAFSVPGTWVTRAIGPVGRVIQRHATRRYVDAVRSAASDER
ncbi:hypothetical protein ASD11_05240 [Aeromicrobium sp. Root495]|uniref:DUF1990 family protein n=1 Tax=Aeromicrobium sp. Root495 TaxID=1736550 RepID=UPI0006F6E9FF|nr:DUF1990 domain-containing protein [Aeromicrobium sp. Root495]KQY59013.1 hypothetical protein ASD11_05240 [Aeromicrobium sp. Root495]